MGSTKANVHNWLSHPHNRWAFTHIDEILSTAVVQKPQTSSNPQRGSLDLSGFELDHAGDKIDFKTYLTQTSTDGLMILQHGKVLYEEYFNGNTRESKHILMSLTKSVTGLLVGIVQAQEKLSVSDPVTKYVPEVSNTIWKDVTIQQCLDMRVGARYVDGQHEYRAATGWNPKLGGEKYNTLKEFLAGFVPQEIIDDSFEYISANTDLLGWILERATGKSYPQILQELLWQPMGAESDALLTVDSEGFARAAGGLCATLPDVARVAQLILNDGKNVDGTQIVPAEWIEDVLHGGSQDAWQRGRFAKAFNPFYESLAYRSCCYADDNSEVIMGWGLFGQHFAVDKRNGIVLVTTASQKDALGFDKIGMTVGAFKKIQRILISA
ncbi:hypothetical protein CKM354_000677200 [Cercospora kikuchii]|uniref:Beta-lactamase-related domain-containing protein n=1 Tax=Cercospora kikuchii TaxID=84275 RepID=A0A9P3CN77_9PEZI|nr:uncharacterized protein CKM354_000677200 [Cercospora kikuchii]GIZ43550.1 hypothetical protein CKM354_000677200 [Cercospora kikuchii]